MFHPPRCPNVHCPEHAHPSPGFCWRHGTYRAKCRAHPIPRFLCKTCGRSFSRQTFRMDYCDHRPDLNRRLFDLLASGVGLRQSSRLLRLSFRCTELKFRKIGRHLARLNAHLRGELSEEDTFLQFDELETYEGRRNTRPLTLPVLIEGRSRFVIWAESAPIRPSGRMTEARLRAIAEDEERFGPRRNESKRAILSTLRQAARLTRDHQTVRLESDEKTVYPSLARLVFGEDRLEHTQTNSKLPRTAWNPLFPINHTEAMARDLMGRLRRESWLVSKLGQYLNLALHYFMAYRNYVRPRFNGEHRSPAQMLGFVPRRLRPTELLSWRQDWGPSRSIHPLARRSESVAEQLRARKAA